MLGRLYISKIKVLKTVGSKCIEALNTSCIYFGLMVTGQVGMNLMYHN